MDNTTHHNIADPQQVAQAAATWHSFTTLAKWATLAVVIGVIGLAIITLSFS